jgi:hypothetical protein
MSKSLEDIWRQMEAQRMAEQQRRATEERAIFEQREIQRQEYLKIIRMYESSSINNSAAAAAAAGAGAGGGGSRIKVSEVNNLILFIFSDDVISKYFIYNFDTNQLSDIVEINGSVYNYTSVNGGGYYIKTQDLNGDKNFYLIGINGEIIWQDSNLSTEWDSYESFSRYVVPYYEKNGVYYLVVMDSNSQVRQITFDNFIDGGGYAYDNVHASGFIAREENGDQYKYWIIPDGSTNPILLKEYDNSINNINVYQYAFSDKILAVTDNYLYEVYSKEVELLASFDITETLNVINEDWYQNEFSFIGDQNGGFSFSGTDNNSGDKIVVYFSGVNNTFSYKSVSGNYDIEADIDNMKNYDSTMNYYNESHAYIFYNQDTDWEIEDVRYSSDIKILPIWSSDLELRDFYTFSYYDMGISNNYDSGNFTMTRTNEYITTIVDTDTEQIYYFSDRSNQPNQIDNGGYNMYDEGNKLYINDEQIPYTHTQLGITKNGGLRSSDYLIDGIVETYYIGGETMSNYFTNIYPGLFVMCAQNTNNIETFKIDGNVGAGPLPLVDNYQYEKDFLDSTYLINVKRIWGFPNSGDFESFSYRPSVNHIIITKGSTYSGITQSVSPSTDSDQNIIDYSGSDLSSPDIYYLLMSMKYGIKISDEQVDSIVEEFLTILDNSSDINDLLTNLNTDYSNITNVLPQGSATYSVMRFNKTGNEVDFLPTSIVKNHNSDDDDVFGRGFIMQYDEDFRVVSDYGWNNLSNIDGRTYSSFYRACNGSIGSFVLGQNFVMKDIESDQYWAIDFTQWTSNSNGGGFAYTRQLISGGTFSGSVISFTHSNYGDEIDVIVPGVLEITRNVNGGIYNSALEEEWNGNGPLGTLWNSFYSLRYTNLYNYFFSKDGVEQDILVINDNYDNNWNGNLYSISAEDEQKTYIINNQNPTEFFEIDGYYSDSSDVSTSVEGKIDPGIILLRKGNKFRLITNDSIVNEIVVDISGGYSINNQRICETGFVVVKIKTNEVIFTFYNINGDLIAEKELTGSDYEYSLNGSGDDKRLAVTWWNDENDVKNFIFFNGDSITEFNSNLTLSVNHQSNLG